MLYSALLNYAADLGADLSGIAEHVLEPPART